MGLSLRLLIHINNLSEETLHCFDISKVVQKKSAYFLTQLPTLNMTMLFSTYTIKNSIYVCDKYIFPD